MEPPSYEEASRHPPAQSTEGLTFSSSPPAYNVSLTSPPTPPPSYGDTVQQNPFPVLNPPSVPTVETRAQDSGFIVHPVSQIGVTPPVSSARAQVVAVVSQPQPVPILVEYLKDSPGFVRCTHCHHHVTSKVEYVPGTGAWCTCVLLALMGLICGFCLIPLMMRGMQDVYHFCPRCGKQLHVYKR